MFKNYLTIAFRNIKAHKGISFINVAGLALGMTCCILILLWVQDELSYEQFYKNADSIYRVNKKYQMGTETGYNPSTPYPLAYAAKQKFAEIKEATRYSRRSTLFKYEDNVFTERRVCFTDTSFFKIFASQFVAGNPKSALSNPNSIVITEDMGNKYFGGSSPMGKTFTVDNSEEFTVTGVVQNIPANSDLQFDFFMPISFVLRPGDGDNWGAHWLGTYVLLHQNAYTNELEQNLSALIKEHLPEEKISLVLQPLKNTHLYSIDGKMEGMKYVYFFSIIAIFILVIACINFMNLATARSSKRAKEVGLRKVVGANRMQITRQFFAESVLYTVFALAVAFVLVELIRPAFNDLTGKSLAFDYSNYKLIIGLTLIVVFTGLLSGSYPALYLSSFRPIKVLKGSSRNVAGSKKNFRKTLVVIQFSLSIILMIGTGIIYSQLKFIQNRDLGYNEENLVYLSMNRELRDKYDVVQRELLQHPDIQCVTRTSELPTDINSIVRGIVWEGKETPEGAAFGFAAVDYDYFETLKMEMAQGRAFSKKFPTDTSNYILNEKAISIMGMDSPIGMQFTLDEDTDGKIVGVVKDFHFLPLTYEMEPLALMILPGFYRQVLIRINSNNITKTISYMEKTWKKFVPGFPFEYHFLDEQFDRLYSNELRAGKLFRYFVILAIFISCLGLFGLASFTAEQRTKEIGVRKVLGATVFNICFLLSKEFTKWVLLANIIAWPVAYYAMNNWLQSFAYKIDIGLLPFLLSAALALVIALITVSYQAVKAAVAKPIEALRYE